MSSFKITSIWQPAVLIHGWHKEAFISVFIRFNKLQVQAKMSTKVDLSEKLISMIREREMLWNWRDPNYHNKERRKVLWAEICNELDSNLEDIYRRWKSLKDTFAREYKKETLFGRKHKWIYYKSLFFLKDRFKYREQNEHDYSGIPLTGVKIEEIDPDGETNQPSSKRKKQKTMPSESVDESLNRSVNIEGNDSDYYFLMSLLPFFKNLKADRKLLTRMKIQQLLCDEQIQHSQQPCPSNSSSAADHQPETATTKNELSSFISTFTVDDTSK